MKQEKELAARVAAAKSDVKQADALIRSYTPYIRAEASRTLGRFCTHQDDAFSIAMMAFNEAILSYQESRGGFLAYAALLIRSRLIDQQRREARQGEALSLDSPVSEDDSRTLGETLPDPADPIAAAQQRDATRQEILELAGVMRGFGVSFADVADNTPRQQRTLEACAAAIRCAGQDKALLEKFLHTQKLPLRQLAAAAGVERKTLERHRQYLVAMLLIQTNGYEIMRGHLKRMLRANGRDKV